MCTVLLYVCMGTIHAKCLQRPEDSIGSQELELQLLVTMWVTGN